MSWGAFFLAGLLAAMVGGVALRRFRLDVGILGVLLALMLAGIISPQEAFSGFAKPATVTVAFLYVVATGIKETGAMNRIGNRILGRAKSPADAQMRLSLPIAALSAFVNNTPVVAVFLPVLAAMARRIRVAPSQLYMPLSFASILGGICTLIGTNTNIVIEGLALEHGGVSLGMFGFARLGVPVALAGLTYILLFGRKLLPVKEERTSSGKAREYMAMMRVRADAPLLGRSVVQANLRNLPGLFLSRIERDDQIIPAVGPNEVLRAGDVLGFVGDLDSVVDLHQIEGLEPALERRPGYSASNRLIEAVISPTSPLIGRSIRESGIRTRYGAVIVAVHRHGHAIEGKLGNVILEAGDTLLLEGPGEFVDQHRNSPEFHLVSALSGSAAPRHERAPVALGLLGLLIVLLSTRVLEPMVSVMLVAALMGVTRCCTAPQARAALDWEVIIVVGAAFGVAHAMRATGLASSLASVLLQAAEPLGPIVLLAGVYVLTAGLTMFLTNIAAAILVFPIAASVGQSAGLSLLPFAACIAIAASCEFSTPIGYQTNLMVMGPGGYRWTDYTRFGGPLTLLCGVVAVALAPIIFGF